MPNPLTREGLQAELALLRAQLDGLPLMHRAITVLQQEVRAVRNDIAFIRANVATLEARIKLIEESGRRVIPSRRGFLRGGQPCPTRLRPCLPDGVSRTPRTVRPKDPRALATPHPPLPWGQFSLQRRCVHPRPRCTGMGLQRRRDSGRGFRPLRISTNSRKSPGLTLTDCTSGFLQVSRWAAWAWSELWKR